MRLRAMAIVVCTLVTAPLGTTGCGGEKPAPATRDTPTTISVSRDKGTISAAVAKAKPGDIVLVAPGVYHETVEIKTPRVTLRGLNRNTVVIDGDVVRPNGIVLTGAGGTVQNLTVRNAVINGILVTGETDGDGDGIGRGSDGYAPSDRPRSPPLQGFHVDHVTSYNNGLYGIYAFNAQHGAIESSYTSGMPDSGIYVGQCKPCDIAVRRNVAERNAVGYEGTNASGRMYVYENRFVGNRVGATTSSDHQEALVPQSDAVFAGNVVAANNEQRTPEQAEGGFGIGLGIAGGTDNTVSRNLVVANATAGLVITSADDLAPEGNRIVRNAFASNGVDVIYAATAAAPGKGNCLSANKLTTVRPPSFPTTCPASGRVPKGVRAPAPRAPGGIAFTEVQAPPLLENLPDAATAGAPERATVDIDRVELPGAHLLQDQSAIRWRVANG